MKRRDFLKSIGATALLPAVPLPASVMAAPAAAVPAFSSHTYQWAEIIVRAHSRCNLGLLQRSLRVDESVALALKNSLIEKGVIAPLPNAYGAHAATRPLYEGAFMNVSDAAEKVVDKIADSFDKSDMENQRVADNQHEFNDLTELDESETDQTEDDEVLASSTLNDEENQSSPEPSSADNSDLDK